MFLMDKFLTKFRKNLEKTQQLEVGSSGTSTGQPTPRKPTHPKIDAQKQELQMLKDHYKCEMTTIQDIAALLDEDPELMMLTEQMADKLNDDYRMNTNQ